MKKQKKLPLQSETYVQIPPLFVLAQICNNKSGSKLETPKRTPIYIQFCADTKKIWSKPPRVEMGFNFMAHKMLQ